MSVSTMLMFANTFGDFKIKTEVTKVDKDVLLKVSNPNYKPSCGHLRSSERSETSKDKDTKPELPIHMILGANVYARIKMKELPRVGEDGPPVAEKTRFGWFVMSPGAEVESNMYLTQSSNQDYDRLCRLDILGLEDRPGGEQNVVYQEFRSSSVETQKVGTRLAYCGKQVIQRYMITKGQV